jgi:6-phosphogluconolactonase
MRCKVRVLLLLVALLVAWAREARSPDSYLIYVGTYTGPASKGIYVLRFEPGTSRWSSPAIAAETANPSFLAIDPSQGFLYAANEVSGYKGEHSGSISAFAIDHKTGKLTLLNEVSSHGAGPCYVALDRTGKYVLVANYDAGNVAVFPVLPDGRLAEASAVVQHAGHGPNAERQQGPHAHQIEVAPDNRFAIVSDLGLDRLLVYRFDVAKGTLAGNDPAFAPVAPGAGPRHFVFDLKGKFVYAINEMSGTITAFGYDAVRASLSSFQTISTLPADFKGENTSAEIAIHPSGKFVYASNRGADTLTILAVEPGKGSLKLVESVSAGGKTPRNFAIDPTGKYLFAANQDSNRIVIFRIDPVTGHLTATGQILEVPSPVCIKFLAAD